MSANGRTLRRRRPGALDLVRAWGGRNVEDLEFAPGPSVVIAGIQQLHAWVRKKGSLRALFPRRKITVVVIDEAHRVVKS